MADEEEEKKRASVTPPPPDIIPPEVATDPSAPPSDVIAANALGSESDPLMYKSFPPEEPGRATADSMSEFEISPASFRPELPMADASSVSPTSNGEDLPPSTVIANAMGRNQAGLSLSAIVGIGAGVLVVAIGLALLLFR
jgi:hypothetical protein